MALDPASLFVGGLVSLAATSVVQIFVVPRVQARNRRLERWERDLLELGALLQEEVPRAVSGLEMAVYTLRLANDPSLSADTDSARLKEYIRKAQKDKREASSSVGEQMAKLSILEGRLELFRPKAPFWRGLSLSRILFHSKIWKLEDDECDDPTIIDDAAFQEFRSAIEASRKALLSKITELTRTMKPPPRKTFMRLRSRLKAKRKKMAPIKRGSQETETKAPTG